MSLGFFPDEWNDEIPSYQTSDGGGGTREYPTDGDYFAEVTRVTKEETKVGKLIRFSLRILGGTSDGMVIEKPSWCNNAPSRKYTWRDLQKLEIEAIDWSGVESALEGLAGRKVSITVKTKRVPTRTGAMQDRTNVYFNSLLPDDFDPAMADLSHEPTPF